MDKSLSEKINKVNYLIINFETDLNEKIEKINDKTIIFEKD